MHHKHRTVRRVVELVEVEVFQPELPERVGVEAHLPSESMTHTDRKVSGGAGPRAVRRSQGLGPGPGASGMAAGEVCHAMGVGQEVPQNKGHTEAEGTQVRVPA